VTAGGGTNLSGGLLEGLKIVKKRPTSTANEVCSILLFTDGEANNGIKDTPGILAAAAQEAGLGWIQKNLPSGDAAKWTVNDVCQWLSCNDLDFEEVVANVKSMKIDGQILMHDLTEEMLEEDLKVSRLHISKFLRELEKLRQGDEEKVEKPDASQLLCTINTFGYGHTHNSDLLVKLAEKFDGMYYYVKDADAINEGFAICLGGLMSTAATNMKLSITPMNGAKNMRILGDFIVTMNDGIVTTNIGDIQSEEKRHILFEVDIPKVRTKTKASTYCSVKLSYDNKITSTADVLLSLLDLKRGRVTCKRDAFVDEQYNRVIAGQALKEADEFGRIGQLEKARGMLDSAMLQVSSSCAAQTPLSSNLISDLTETRKGYSTKKDYSTWGRNYSKQNCIGLQKERAFKLNDGLGQYLTQSDYMNVSKVYSVSQFNDSCSDDSDDFDCLFNEIPRKHANSLARNRQSQKCASPYKSTGRLSLGHSTVPKARERKAQYVSDFMLSLGQLTKPKPPIGKRAKFEYRGNEDSKDSI
jgi:hypothetical protein